jgi:SAM-dependent methyltransferase
VKFTLETMDGPEGEEAVEVTWCFDARLPGQRVWMRPWGLTFQNVCSGKTPKGVFWVNGHRGDRQNSAPEMRFRASQWLVGKGLDIGCGMEKITPECTGVDAGDYQEGCDADVIGDVVSMPMFADGEFDWAYSSNVLEHIKDWRGALKEWVRVLKPLGMLFLCLPWADRCRVNDYRMLKVHEWNPSPGVLEVVFKELGLDVMMLDDDVDRWGCFCIVGQKKA